MTLASPSFMDRAALVEQAHQGVKLPLALMRKIGEGGAGGGRAIPAALAEGGAPLKRAQRLWRCHPDADAGVGLRAGR